jgi:hypothetical protein
VSAWLATRPATDDDNVIELRHHPTIGDKPAPVTSRLLTHRLPAVSQQVRPDELDVTVSEQPRRDIPPRRRRRLLLQRARVAESHGVLHRDRVDDVEQLLVRAARAAGEHRRSVGERSVTPARSAEHIRAAFAGPLPDGPTDPEDVLTKLLSAADGAITGTAGPRYFGFVIGGALPAASAADVLTGLGPASLQRGPLPRRGRGRACGRRLGEGVAPAAGRVVGGVRDRRPGRQHRRPRDRQE